MSALLPIPVFAGSLAEAWAQAKAANEPRLVEIRAHADDRGWSYMNLMTGVLAGGQVNVSAQHPGVIKAWHRHAKQTDFWCTLGGHLKVGVWRDTDDACWSAVTGDRRPAIVVIPPTLWHGAATVGPEPATLLYYVTHAYDPANPDEERRPHEALPRFGWGVEHR
ncbi:MAG: hypothetical protein DHS20C14_08570 [Phycisphaeraceae bacterium]|nr:MAG: hypothetical protein DHS20C14_08570 [Phycisphaeraceae bacterium]